jgi:hypothetical protein
VLARSEADSRSVMNVSTTQPGCPNPRSKASETADGVRLYACSGNENAQLWVVEPICGLNDDEILAVDVKVVHRAEI